MAIDWTRGYTAHWRLYEVNQSTWTDGARLDGVVSASVERDCTGDAPELESASIELDTPVTGDFSERVLRLVMVAEQNGETERADICTMRFGATSGTIERGVHTRTLRGRSVLHTAAVAETWLDYGAYVPSGADGAAEVGKMLSDTITAPVEVIGSFVLQESYVFDRSEHVLESAWAILKAGGYHIRIDGRGRVFVEREPTKPAYTLNQDTMRLLMPSVQPELDWSDVPNRYTAIEGDSVYTITNDDAASVTSTVRRGYVVPVTDTSPIRIDGESLDAYASRKLAELSVASDKRRIEREYEPDIHINALVRATIAQVGMEGDYRSKRQSLKCGAGIVVTEQLEREVRSWPVS